MFETMINKFQFSHSDGDISELSLGDVHQFATGRSSAPILGYRQEPSIDFKKGKFPKASTCANNLYLPLYSSSNLDEFCNNLIFAIKNSPGFGLA
jgi:hypothetical protein